MKIRFLVFDKFTGEVYIDTCTKTIYNVADILSKHMKIYQSILSAHHGACLYVLPLGDQTEQLSLFNP